MEVSSPSVNLLKTKGNNFSDKFIKWALTIGRMSIILTETVALAAFLYRFVLDREIIDQKDRINQTAAQIRIYENNENSYRNLQDRLQLITKTTSQASDSVEIFNDIVQMAPQTITFNTININGPTLHVDASVQSVSALNAFVNKLKQYPKITSVSIDKIENKTLNATIIVGITAKLELPPPIVVPTP